MLFLGFRCTVQVRESNPLSQFLGNAEGLYSHSVDYDACEKDHRQDHRLVLSRMA